MEYLDSLVDKQIAEDNAGQVESSAKGDGLGGTETINGIIIAVKTPTSVSNHPSLATVM